MSVEASKTMGEAWGALEGRLVNGVFPLRRYLGGSDRSGVFLSELAGREPSHFALKLVPITPALADSQFSRWLAASGLEHPHLLRLLDSGRCQVEGQPFLFAVMEYADQNLAQLLEHRALTEDEAREMLVPTLQALAFLHERKLVQGGLKPSNVLVVGDLLKLASDTIRSFGEARDNANTISAYDPPETREGLCSGAADVWALGVTLCEALTRRQPSVLREDGGRVVLPAELPPAFREVVGRCLSRRPEGRPSVADIQAWVGGQPLAPAPTAVTQPSAVSPIVVPPAAAMTPTSPKAARPAAQTAERVPRASRGVAQGAKQAPAGSESVASRETTAAPSSSRRAFPLIVGALTVLALGWAGMRMLRTNQPPTAPVAEAPRDAVIESPTASQTSSASETPSSSKTPGTSPARTPSSMPSITAPPVSAAPPPSVAGADTTMSHAEVHKDIPDVPRRARQTIRGTVRVSVRVIVSKDGTVFAALTDRRGPSRYFERLALESAKKWTFTPVDTDAERLMLLRFDFTRAGTTARAVPVK